VSVRRARPPRRLATLALVLASVIVSVGVLEAAFRLAHVPVGTVQINRATIRRSADPRLRYELRPGARAAAEVEYRINAAGLRGPEADVPKPPGRSRVAVLGDSIAFGYWVAEADGQGLVRTGRRYENRFRAHPHPEESASLTFAVLGDFGTGVRKPSRPEKRQREVAGALTRRSGLDPAGPGALPAYALGLALASLILYIGLSNLWNRLNVPTRQIAGEQSW